MPAPHSFSFFWGGVLIHGKIFFGFFFVYIFSFLCLYVALQVSISCSHLKDGLFVDHNTFIIRTAISRRMLLINFGNIAVFSFP